MGEADSAFEGHLEMLCLLGTLESVKAMREGAFWKLWYAGISFSCERDRDSGDRVQKSKLMEICADSSSD